MNQYHGQVRRQRKKGQASGPSQPLQQQHGALSSPETNNNQAPQFNYCAASNSLANSQQSNQPPFGDPTTFATQLEGGWTFPTAPLQQNAQPVSYDFQQWSNGGAGGNTFYPSQTNQIFQQQPSQGSNIEVTESPSTSSTPLFPGLLDKNDMFYQVSRADVAFPQSTAQSNFQQPLNDASAGMFNQQQQQQQLTQMNQHHVSRSDVDQTSYYSGSELSHQQQQHLQLSGQSNGQYQVQQQQHRDLGSPVAGMQQCSFPQLQAPMILNSNACFVPSNDPACRDNNWHDVPILPYPFAAESQDGHEEQGDEGEMIARAPCGRGKKNPAPGQKAKITRDRNREHARSSRIRKKEYVTKLKELVEELNAERTEETRKRRIAAQHLEEKLSVRRAVLHSFLNYLADFEGDARKWSALLEDGFWLMQPITPFRYFPQSEIEGDHRMSRGVESMINEAASLSVMIEGIGNRSPQCMQIQRENFLQRLGGKDAMAMQALMTDVPSAFQQNAFDSSGTDRNSVRRTMTNMPSSVGGSHHNVSRYHRAVSSLSWQSGAGSSGSSSGSSSSNVDGEVNTQRKRKLALADNTIPVTHGERSDAVAHKQHHTKMVSSSCSEVITNSESSSNDFHDYNAPSLPDPRPDSLVTSRGYVLRNGGEFQNGASGAPVSDGGNYDNGRLNKKFRSESSGACKLNDDGTTAAVKDGKKPNTISSDVDSGLPAIISTVCDTAPPNAESSGGISPSNNSVVTSRSTFNGRRNIADTAAIKLPPFLGLGKKSSNTFPYSTSSTSGNSTTTTSGPPLVTDVAPRNAPSLTTTVTAAVSAAPEKTPSAAAPSFPPRPRSSDGSNDTDTSSCSATSQQLPHIQAYFHVNDDEMILAGDAMMCPFLFRSQDAVVCGALADVHIPGMLRAQFSPTNKLQNVEMIYDAMGLMQQLERASGSEGIAQVIPNSVEMALAPKRGEARVITLAKAPYLIISVNEDWTILTQYTQAEVEGRQLSILDGKLTNFTAGKRYKGPVHECAEVAKGRCAASMNIHYDKAGREFVDFVCSYPLTNASDEVTHLLHVFKEYPRSALFMNFSLGMVDA